MSSDEYGPKIKLGSLKLKPATLVKNGRFKPSRVFETFLKTLAAKGIVANPRRGPGIKEFQNMEYLKREGDPSWYASFQAEGDDTVNVYTNSVDSAVQKRLSEKLKEVAAELNDTPEKLEYGVAAMKATQKELPQDVERYMLSFIGKDLKDVPGAPLKALALKTQKQKKGKGSGGARRSHHRSRRLRLL
jgi:hypothetical protein